MRQTRAPAGMAKSAWNAEPGVFCTQWSGQRVCAPYGICISSYGLLPSCCDANELCFGGCQSWDSTTCLNRGTSAFTIGITSVPPGTSRAPPGMKSICTSITSRPSRSEGANEGSSTSAGGAPT